MTKEERIKKMAEVLGEIESLVAKANDLEIKISGGESVDISAKSKVENDIGEKKAEYNNHARALCYEECLETGNAMLAAVTRRQYKVVNIKDEQEEGCPLEHKVDWKVKDIDLLDLNKTVEGGIGNEKNWPHYCQKMNFLLTVDRAKGLGVATNQLKTINDSYTMSKIAQDFDMGKNPVSNTQLLKTMQTIITAMLGDEYKPKSHDVVYLKSVYAKKGRKALAVQCSDHRRFVGYMADVCHRIVTNGTYTVESREIKTKE